MNQLAAWKTIHDIDDRAVLEALRALHESVIPAVGALASIVVEWRPPLHGVFDRLQKNPESMIAGAIRGTVTWESACRETKVQHAFDFEGDQPAAKDVVRLKQVLATAVFAVYKELS